MGRNNEQGGKSKIVRRRGDPIVEAGAFAKTAKHA